MKVVLISCVRSKLARPAPAEKLYTSPLFRLNLAYARSLKPDRIYILSAKHGLVRQRQIVRPYEQTLNNMRDADIRAWADRVKKQMKGRVGQDDEVVFLAGERYRKYLSPMFKKSKIPLQGLGLGRQLAFLKRHVSM